MATKKKNLSEHSTDGILSAKGLKFGIVVSEWNKEVTEALLDGAKSTLMQYGAGEKDILIKWVPGSFELTLGAQLLAEHTNVDAVICLGCVIQGETKHFDFICQGVAYGITELNIDYSMPFIFGVLTTNTMEQALARAGGNHGNKGIEAAVTAIKMIQLKQSF